MYDTASVMWIVHTLMPIELTNINLRIAPAISLVYCSHHSSCNSRRC